MRRFPGVLQGKLTEVPSKKEALDEKKAIMIGELKRLLKPSKKKENKEVDAWE